MFHRKIKGFTEATFVKSTFLCIRRMKGRFLAYEVADGKRDQDLELRRPYRTLRGLQFQVSFFGSPANVKPTFSLFCMRRKDREEKKRKNKRFTRILIKLARRDKEIHPQHAPFFSSHRVFVLCSALLGLGLEMAVISFSFLKTYSFPLLLLSLAIFIQLFVVPSAFPPSHYDGAFFLLFLLVLLFFMLLYPP